MTKQSTVTCLNAAEKVSPSRALRFVKGPDNTVWFDRTLKAPGDGVFLALDFGAWENAEELLRSALSAEIQPDLWEKVDVGLKAIALTSLSLCKKSGSLIAGLDKCRESCAKNQVSYVVLADDAGSDTKKRAESFEKYGIKVYKGLTKDDIATSVGGFNVSIVAILKGTDLEIPLQRYQLFRQLIQTGVNE